MAFGAKSVLHNASLTIRAGEFVCITGPNGGGKTTLLRIILGLLRPSAGAVQYLRHSQSAKKTSVGYLPQKSSIDSQFPMTVGQTVKSGVLPPRPRFRHTTDVADHRAVDAVCEALGLTDLTDRPLGTLSGGQVQRALIARALAGRPQVVVMDEPLSYLDRDYAAVLLELLSQLRGRVTLIVVSHQPEQLKHLCDKIYYVDHTVEEISAHN